MKKLILAIVILIFAPGCTPMDRLSNTHSPHLQAQYYAELRGAASQDHQRECITYGRGFGSFLKCHS